MGWKHRFGPTRLLVAMRTPCPSVNLLSKLPAVEYWLIDLGGADKATMGRPDAHRRSISRRGQPDYATASSSERCSAGGRRDVARPCLVARKLAPSPKHWARA